MDVTAERIAVAKLSRESITGRMRATLDSMTRTTNLASLADLATYAGILFDEMSARGLSLEFRR